MSRARAAAVAAVALLAAAAWAAGASAAAGTAAAGAGPRLRAIASGLDQPVYVTAAPGDAKRLFVVEQPGLIRVLEGGRLRAAPFLDVRSLVSCCGERGLLSVAFAPDWATSRRLYVDYTDAQGDTRVVEYRADRAGTRALPATARRLLAVAQPYPNHNGGQLQFGPDGLLYVGMGDGGSGGDPENRAQDPGSMLGKLLAIDTRSGRVTQAAIGLRNPWRFSFDAATGDLWIGDVGQNAWEEIDRARRGTLPLNFGWSLLEGRTPFKDGAAPASPPLAWPVAVYSHDDGCSVTGGYVYRGAGVPSLRGRYVYGDYCSGTVWSLPATAAPAGPGAKGASVPRREPFAVQGLVSFGLDAQGELLAVAQSGTISRVVP